MAAPLAGVDHVTAMESGPDFEDIPLEISPIAPTTLRGRRLALGVLLLLALAIVGLLAAPLWVGLMMGTVMAFSAQPLFRALVPRLGGRRAIAAAITTTTGALVLLGGGTLVVYVLLGEVADAAEAAQLSLTGGAAEAQIQRLLGHVSRYIGLDDGAVIQSLREEVGRSSAMIAREAGSLIKELTSLLLSVVISLWSMYYVLVNWPVIAVRLERVLPLDSRHTRALIFEFRDVGRSAFVGTLVTAVAQGLLAAAGFFMIGVPRALVLGLLTGLASFLPLFGTAFIFVPVGIYFIAKGELATGILTLLWGSVVVVGLADYVLRPRLVGSRTVTDPLVMLVALIGGLEVMGVAGLIVGPMFMSLFLAIARIYEKEVAGEMASASPDLDVYRNS